MLKVELPEGGAAMRLIHEQAPPSALRVLRIVVFGTWFARVAFKPLQGDYSVVAPSLEERVSMMRLVPHAHGSDGAQQRVPVRAQGRDAPLFRPRHRRGGAPADDGAVVHPDDHLRGPLARRSRATSTTRAS